jgi:hypothetical protein
MTVPKEMKLEAIRYIWAVLTTLADTQLLINQVKQPTEGQSSAFTQNIRNPGQERVKASHTI